MTQVHKEVVIMSKYCWFRVCRKGTQRRETAPGATTKKAHFYLTRCLLKKCCDFSSQNFVLFILTYSLSGLLLIAIPLATAAIVNCYWSILQPEKTDKGRRKGKGRRLCLEGRIYSIPCRASSFTLDDLTYLLEQLHQDDMKEKDKFILFFKIVLVQNS